MPTPANHPCPYSRELMPVLIEACQGIDYPLFGKPLLLDPFAGTGRAAEIAAALDYEYVGYEIEPEFAACEPRTICGDSSKMDRIETGSVAVICTSPAYGGRMADQYLGTPAEQELRATTGKLPRRRSYAIALGRRLHDRNGGKYQWGAKYRELHADVLAECDRVLRPGGRMVLNVSNHHRRRQEVSVVAWFEEQMRDMGWTRRRRIPVETRRFRDGANRDARPTAEYVLVYEKGTL